jgi:hypothetical protein
VRGPRIVHAATSPSRTAAPSINSSSP